MSINDLLLLLQERHVVLRKEGGQIFADWYGSPPDQALVEAIRSNKRALEEYLDALTFIRPCDAEDLAATSRAQRRIWLACQSNAGRLAYNLGCKLSIDGPLDIHRLRKAVNAAMGTYPSLSASFVESSNGLLRKIGENHVDVFIDRTSCLADPVLDLRAATAPFDLQQGPLVRVSLCGSGAMHVLYVALHHILTDGFGVQLFVREIFKQYVQDEGVGASHQGVQEGNVHARYIALERRYIESAAYQDDLRYWNEHLAHYVPESALLPDFERQGIYPRAVTFAGRTEGFERACLHERSRAFGCTPHHLLLTCAFIALRDMSHRHDFAMCVPVHLRDHAEQFDAMGLFLNVLPIRVRLAPGSSFVQCLQAVRQAFDEAYVHKRTAFEDIARAVALKGQPAALMSMMFVHNEGPPHTQQIGDLRVQAYSLPSPAAKCHFNLFAHECGDRVFCSLEFDADLFSWLTAEALLERFEETLHAALQPQKQKHSVSRDVAHELPRLQRWRDMVTDLLALNTDPEDKAHQREIAYEVLQDEMPIVKVLNAMESVLAVRLGTSAYGHIFEKISWAEVLTAPAESSRAALGAYLLGRPTYGVLRCFIAVEADVVRAVGVLADVRHCFACMGAAAIMQDIIAWLAGEPLAQLQLPRPLNVPDMHCPAIKALSQMGPAGIAFSMSHTGRHSGWHVAEVKLALPIAFGHARCTNWLIAIAITLYRYTGRRNMVLEVRGHTEGSGPLSHFMPVAIHVDPHSTVGELRQMVGRILSEVAPLALIAPGWARARDVNAEDPVNCRVQITFSGSCPSVCVSNEKGIYLSVGNNGALHATVDGRWFDTNFPSLFADSLVRLMSRDDSDAVLVASIGVLAERRHPEPMNGDPCQSMEPDPGATLVSRFLEQARLRPLSIALQCGSCNKTYSALLQESLANAVALRDAGARRGTLVAVLLSDPFEYASALVTVALSGAAYLPIDPDWPTLRRRSVLHSASPDLIILDADHDEKIEVATVTWPLRAPSPPLTGAWDPATIDPLDLAYVIYTSGSTGSPKGVAITHGAAMSTILEVIRRIGMGPDDAVYAVSSFAFDLSVFDLFGALAAGAKVVLPQPAAQMRPSAWLDDVMTHSVTVWNSVPALAQMLVEKMEEAWPNVSLRCVMLSGDRIPVSLPDRFQLACHPEHMLSLGGATEASIWSIAYPVVEPSSAWRSIPYGQPLAGQFMDVLDEDGQECPINVPGEIHISGSGLAQGYWRAPEATAGAFFFHEGMDKRLYRTGDLGYRRADGLFEILGRIDKRVKLRGHRIELGEIEATLRQHRDVMDAVAWTEGEGMNAQLAVAVCTAKGDIPSSLLSWLAEWLPVGMRPMRYLGVTRWPLTANGKIDTEALRALESAPVQPVTVISPGTSREVQLLAVWRVLLGFGDAQSLCIHDNFFDIGGHSLLAVKLLEQLNSQGLNVPYRIFLKCATVSALAAYLDNLAMLAH